MMLERVSTGLKELDDLIEGGFPVNTTVLVSGDAGTGKTLLALNFLKEGVVNGEKCCYVSLNESKEEILKACSTIKSLKVLERYLDKNFAIIHIDMSEKNLDIENFAKLISKYPKLDRIVIDNINKLLIFAKDNREYRINLSKILRHLKEKVRCSMILCETDNGIDSGNGESFECDSVIKLSFIEFGEEPLRTLGIYKVRYTSFKPRISYELVIDKEGIKLGRHKVLS